MLRAEPLALGNRQKKVYEALKFLGSSTDVQLSRFLSWPINTITPRRGELVKLGLIEKCGTTFDLNTDRPVYLWRVLK